MSFLGFGKGRFLKGKEHEFVASVRQMTGYRPENLVWYRKAFYHSSLQKTDNKGRIISNERLEFLGDAVLSAIIADELFRRYPYKNEGFLTSMRSKIVSRKQLNKLAIQLGIHKMLEANLQANSRSKSLYGDALEALVGAVFLDLGFSKTRSFVLNRIIKGKLDFADVIDLVASYKSKLIEWTQKERKEINFEIVSETGEQHNLTYHVDIFIDNKLIGGGIGRSKKMAEESASRAVCENLHIV